MEHVDALWEACRDPELWRILSSRVSSREEMAKYIRQALDDKAAVPFATVNLASGLVVGTTRFGNIAPEHKRVEIGWTMITPAFQRTYVNTEAKYLMLRHAFEVWGCLRVEMKTNLKNIRSQRAMLRIGATPEGVLRSHMINPDGSVRDTVYFSVIRQEWPEVKLRLEQMMVSP